MGCTSESFWVQWCTSATVQPCRCIGRAHPCTSFHLHLCWQTPPRCFYQPHWCSRPGTACGTRTRSQCRWRLPCRWWRWGWARRRSPALWQTGYPSWRPRREHRDKWATLLEVQRYPSSDTSAPFCKVPSGYACLPFPTCYNQRNTEQIYSAGQHPQDLRVPSRDNILESVLSRHTTLPAHPETATDRTTPIHPQSRTQLAAICDSDWRERQRLHPQHQEEDLAFLKRLSRVEVIFSLPPHTAFTACVYSKDARTTGMPKKPFQAAHKGQPCQSAGMPLGKTGMYLGTRNRPWRKHRMTSLEIMINAAIMPQYILWYFWRPRTMQRGALFHGKNVTKLECLHMLSQGLCSVSFLRGHLCPPLGGHALK